MPISDPYLQFYSDATKDPLNGNYQAAMDDFVYPLGGGPPNTAQELQQKVYDAGNTGPVALMLLVQKQGEQQAYVQAYHRVVRFSPVLGTPTPFDNEVFAFIGDIQQGQQPMSIRWDAGYFGVLNQDRVPSVAAIDQLLAADPAAELLGPFNDQDTDTELVRVRRTILYVPHILMPLLLEQRLSPDKHSNR